MNFIIKCAVLVLGSLIIAFSAAAADRWPAEPPAEAPADWGPVSANFEEIDYPYPVQFLKLRRFEQDMNMALWILSLQADLTGKRYFGSMA